MTDLAVTKQTFPTLHFAMWSIELDNGGHLIGTVYPGEPVNLESFMVPAPWAPLVPFADAALWRLRQASETEFETFVVGEASEQERLVAADPGLRHAHRLLDDWFNGWQPEWQPRPDEIPPTPLEIVFRALIDAVSAAIAKIVTDHHYQMMHNALGYLWAAKSYRNYYCAPKDSESDKRWRDLVAIGFATVGHSDGRLNCYHVTDAGRKFVDDRRAAEREQ